MDLLKGPKHEIIFGSEFLRPRKPIWVGNRRIVVTFDTSLSASLELRLKYKITNIRYKHNFFLFISKFLSHLPIFAWIL